MTFLNLSIYFNTAEVERLSFHIPGTTSIRPLSITRRYDLEQTLYSNYMVKTEKKPHHKFSQIPGLQQLIQLYCYLYITDTLYSGEIIGRIIHIILCDAPQGHKYWCGRPERGGRKLLGGKGLCTVHFPSPAIICLSELSVPEYLPVTTETHLTATWGEKPSPAATFSHIQPPLPIIE